MTPTPIKACTTNAVGPRSSHVRSAGGLVGVDIDFSILPTQYLLIFHTNFNVNEE